MKYLGELYDDSTLKALLDSPYEFVYWAITGVGSAGEDGCIYGTYSNADVSISKVLAAMPMPNEIPEEAIQYLRARGRYDVLLLPGVDTDDTIITKEDAIRLFEEQGSGWNPAEYSFKYTT